MIFGREMVVLDGCNLFVTNLEKIEQNYKFDPWHRFDNMRKRVASLSLSHFFQL